MEADAAGAEAVIVEAIKLVEGGLAALCDEVWLVTCDPASQRVRLMDRGTFERDAGQRVAAQGDLTDRLRGAATRMIDTSGDAEATRRLAESALEAVAKKRST